MLPELRPHEKAVLAVFANGSADGLLALSWLAAVTDYMGILPTGPGRSVTEPMIHAELNAKRAVFSDVYRILMTSDEGREALSAVLTAPLPQPSIEE